MENVQKLKDAGDYTATIGEFGSSGDPVIDKPIYLRIQPVSRTPGPLEGVVRLEGRRKNRGQRFTSAAASSRMRLRRLPARTPQAASGECRL